MSRLPLALLIVLLCVAVLGGGAGLAVKQRADLTDSGKAFVDGLVPSLATNWSDAQLLSRATPTLRVQLHATDLDAISGAISQLGGFIQYLGATGRLDGPFWAPFTGTPSGTFAAKASFIDGVATFHFIIVRQSDRWFIQGFHLDTLSLTPLGPRL